MSKENNRAEHDEYKKNLDRLSEVAESEFEKREVMFFESLGTWINRISNNACDAHEIGTKARKKIDEHIQTEKGKLQGMKTFIWVLGAIVSLLTIGSIIWGILK